MSNEKRKTIGRQLNTQASIAEMTDTGRSQVFTLKTGRKVTFRFVRVPASEVESKTFVNQENNGRDQLALTRESLKSIIQTIKFQQFFPCIGIKQVKGLRYWMVQDGEPQQFLSVQALM